MDQQRLQLPEADPVPEAFGQRADFRIAVVEGLPGAAEQFEHGQVQFAMGAVGSGIDQPGSALAPEDVPGPEVTVDPRRGLDRAGEISGPVGDPFDRFPLRRIERTAGVSVGG